MAEFPAMPLWTDAYLADTGHLSTVEHGAYLLLLMTMWRAGGRLPNDDTKLAKFCRLSVSNWRKMKDHIFEFFLIDGDEITQKRLVKEFEFVRGQRKKQSDRAKAKYLKNNEVVDAVAPLRQAPGSAPTPTPTPTPIIEDKKKDPADPKKGKRIPADFQPDTEWAMREGLTLSEARREAENFRDFWTAKSGKDATKLDWPATWRTWVRNSLKRNRAPPGRTKTAFQEHQDRATATLERALNRGSEHEQRSRFDDGQPAFDLAPGDFRSDRKAGFESK